MQAKSMVILSVNDGGDGMNTVLVMMVQRRQRLGVRVWVLSLWKERENE